jgi:hypothetical protein
VEGWGTPVGHISCHLNNDYDEPRTTKELLLHMYLRTELELVLKALDLPESSLLSQN